MDEKAKNGKKKMKKVVVVWGSRLIVLLIFVLFIFVGVSIGFICLSIKNHVGDDNFYNYLEVLSSSSVGHLGTLGDFFGGILNPILSFITITILVAVNFYEFRKSKIIQQRDKKELRRVRNRDRKESKKSRKQLRLAEDAFHLKQISEAINYEFILFDKLMGKKIEFDFYILDNDLEFPPKLNCTSLRDLVNLNRAGGKLPLLSRSVNYLYMQYEPVGSNIRWNELFGVIEELRNVAVQIDFLTLEFFVHSKSKAICLSLVNRVNKAKIEAAQAGAFTFTESKLEHDALMDIFDRKFQDQNPIESTTPQSDQA